MGVRQLEEFLGQADQKGLWIFTYANLGGAFMGAFAGNSLLERLAASFPSLKLLGIVLGALLGVMATWKVKGHPIYKWALSYLAFVLRRYLKLGFGDSTIDAGPYYRSRAVKQEPFMLVTTRDGWPVPVLVHRGSGTGSSDDPLDGIFVPSLEAGAWGADAGVHSLRALRAGAGIDLSSSSSPLSHNGQSPQLATVDEQSNLDFGEWGL